MKNQMQIRTNALKVKTSNVGLHAAKADKATISRSPVDQEKSGNLSFSAPDQTFRLTASIDNVFKCFITKLKQPAFA